MPPDRREGALQAAEAQLARIDPLWAWELVRDLLGPARAATSLVGLQLEARYDDGSGRRLKEGATDSVYARTLAADEAARAVFRGELRDPGDVRLRPLLADPTGRALLPSEASSYLVAIAAIDASLGLSLSAQLLTRHALGAEPLTLLARSAVAAGMAGEVAARARERSFASVQAAWIEAAALSDALTREAIIDSVLRLAPRVADEADPGTELVAGLPLLVALARSRAPGPLCALALEWRCPPTLLSDELLHTGCRDGARSLADEPAFAALTAVAPMEWNPGAVGCALRPTGADGPELRRAAAADALVIAAAQKWDPFPGTLADLLLPARRH
jgi:hypothetical protein